MSEDEARRELSPYGQITACWFSSDTEREMYQLPEGIWVKFAFFQDCRDAQSVCGCALISLGSMRRLTTALSLPGFPRRQFLQGRTAPEPGGSEPHAPGSCAAIPASADAPAFRRPTACGRSAAAFGTTNCGSPIDLHWQLA